MYSNDPYDTATPKYSTAQSIYDGLCELVKTEEMSVLGEMFADVSWENQDYYYTYHGNRLKEQFNDISDGCDKMWLVDLAVWQIDQGEVHDLVYEALINPDMAKRIGFRKLFIEYMLYGDKTGYDEIIEDFTAELSDLNRFDSHSMLTAWIKVMKQRAMGEYYGNPYPLFCAYFTDKLRNLQLHKETKLVSECRALLTSYDDFMFGLRANQDLYGYLEKEFSRLQAKLQSAYTDAVKEVAAAATQQGIILSLPASLPAIEPSLELPSPDVVILHPEGGQSYEDER